MNILFVCTGNTCRSPMAEVLLKDKLPQAKVQSAGVFAVDNQPINENARNVLNRKGITFTHHSQQVTEKLLHWADLVLTMTTEHTRSLILQYPDYQEKYFTLKEYVSNGDKIIWDKLKKIDANYKEDKQLDENLSNYNISDPFGGNVDVYERTLAELDKYINLLINKIK